MFFLIIIGFFFRVHLQCYYSVLLQVLLYKWWWVQELINDFSIQIEPCFICLCFEFNPTPQLHIDSSIPNVTTKTIDMASSGLRENVIFTKIIPSTDGTIGCAKSDTWCQIVWHQILVQDHIFTSAVWYRHKLCSPLPPVWLEEV